MFRMPMMLLSDTVTVNTVTYTGMGEVLNVGTPFRCRIDKTEKWLSTSDGATIQAVTKLIANSPLELGTQVTLPTGETLEIKVCTPVRNWRTIVGYEMTGW